MPLVREDMMVYIRGFCADGDYGSGNHRVLLEVHNMVHQLMKRVEGTEKELQNLKVRMSTPSSDSSSSSHGRKRTVPLTVRVCTE